MDIITDRRQSCDRCGRVATDLSYDEISQKNLCAACLNKLRSRRLSRQ
jgi:hypothetical protein